MQSLVKIGERTATKDENQWCFLFVSLCVCHAGCPGKRSGRSTTYNVTFVDQFQYGFQSFYKKKRTFQLIAEISTLSLGGAASATILHGIDNNFEKF